MLKAMKQEKIMGKKVISSSKERPIDVTETVENFSKHYDDFDGPVHKKNFLVMIENLCENASEIEAYAKNENVIHLIVYDEK